MNEKFRSAFRKVTGNKKKTQSDTVLRIEKRVDTITHSHSLAHIYKLTHTLTNAHSFEQKHLEAFKDM